MNIKHFLSYLIAACVLLTAQFALAAPQDGSWVSIPTSISPPGRLRHALTYNDAHHKAVLFGGTGFSNGSFTVLGDTWLWSSESKNWQGPLILSSAPSPRYGSSMVYDANRNVVVLFGGAGSDNIPLADTWEFDGSVWTQIIPLTAPTSRIFHTLTYDSARRQTLLFGGVNSSTLFQDTWSWNGQEWMQVANSGPPSRELHAMSYDSFRDRVVVFGGYQIAGYLNDLWEFDSTSWRINPLTGPTARIESSLTYLENLKYSILFGGLSEVGLPLADTWLWNGSAWRELLIAGPTARRSAMSTYDSQLGGVLLFGGTDNSGNLYGDTWLFSLPEPSIVDIKPARPVLKTIRKKVRVRMQRHADIRYVISYYEKVSGKKKPKITTLKRNTPTVDISRLKNGRKYIFSYRYITTTKPIIQSKSSAKVLFKVSYKGSVNRR